MLRAVSRGVGAAPSPYFCLKLGMFSLGTASFGSPALEPLGAGAAAAPPLPAPAAPASIPLPAPRASPSPVVACPPPRPRQGKQVRQVRLLQSPSPSEACLVEGFWVYSEFISLKRYPEALKVFYLRCLFVESGFG